MVSAEGRREKRAVGRRENTPYLGLHKIRDGRRARLSHLEFTIYLLRSRSIMIERRGRVQRESARTRERERKRERARVRERKKRQERARERERERDSRGLTRAGSLPIYFAHYG